MHVDVGCTYNEPEPMFAFAFRTHAHKLGMWKVKSYWKDVTY